MGPQLTFEYNPLSYAFPDDENDKELFLQVTDSTHTSHLHAVFIYWVNTVFSDGEEVWQVVRLGERDHRLRYIYPDLIVVDGCERECNQTCSLGVFSRDQREAILECADEVEYDSTTWDERECWRWMGRLLDHIVDQGLLARSVVDDIKDGVPALTQS